MSRYNNLQIPTAIRPDVKLGKLTVSRIGKYFAYNESLDGYNVVEVKPQQLTATERDFLCGNPLKSTIVLDEDVTAVVTDVSSAFPNLKTVLVGNSEQVVNGLDTMIGDLQGVTVIVPNSLESAYQAAYPSLTFGSWVFDVVFTIPYIGDSTLTADYVRSVAQATGGQIETVTKVVVPVEFTAYENGSIQAIQDEFTSMETLTTCYEAGNIDLDMNGDIAAKIVEIGKTVDEALVYARGLKPSDVVASSPNFKNAIIIPPLINNTVTSLFETLFNCPKLVYVAYLEATQCIVSKNIYLACPNLIEANVNFGTKVVNCYNSHYPNPNLKRLSWTAHGITSYGRSVLVGLEKVLLNGWVENIDFFANATLLTRQALLDLINSLGTPSTTKTLTIGANNLAKLTAEDIAIATNKGWQLA